MRRLIPTRLLLGPSLVGLLLLGIVVAASSAEPAAASEAGGTRRSLKSVLASGEVDCVVIARVLKVKHFDDRDEARQQTDDGVVVTSTWERRAVIELKVDGILYGPPAALGLRRVGYREPMFMNRTTVRPDGSETPGLHTLGYIYTGSGLELSPKLQDLGAKAIFLVHHPSPGVSRLLRAEPVLPQVMATITRTLEARPSKAPAHE